MHGGADGTPLICAAKGGHKVVLEWLIRRGADVNKTECDGLTSLDCALLEDQDEIAKLIEAHEGKSKDPPWSGGREKVRKMAKDDDGYK